MTVAALMDQLKGAGVELFIEGNRLGFRAPKGMLTPEIRQALAENKVDILAALATNKPDDYGPGRPSPENAVRPVAELC